MASFTSLKSDDVNNLPLAICLMGPTGVGKTALAVDLIQRFPLEIISVDSAMVYRGMNIGTAKPDAATLAKAPHRLLDICDPTTPYSAGQFCKDALAHMAEITTQGKVPLLVGGTMLYFHSLQQGLATLPSATPEVRLAIIEDAKRYGWDAMHTRLQTLDPVLAARIHPNDPQRIQRALEVCLVTGQPGSRCFQEEANPAPFRFINLALAPPPKPLYWTLLRERFTTMLQAGLLAEVQALYERGDLPVDSPAIRAVGYRQVWAYLAGELSWEAMVEKAVVATRQLAKRQMTWLRAWRQPVDWYDSANPDLVKDVSQALCAQFA